MSASDLTPEEARDVAAVERLNRMLVDVFHAQHGRDPDYSDSVDWERVQAIAEWQSRGCPLPTGATYEVRKPGLRVDLLRPDDAARFLGVEPRTLETWRYRGGGPVFVRISASCVRYDIADLDNWIAERKRRSTSDNEGAS